MALRDYIRKQILKSIAIGESGNVITPTSAEFWTMGQLKNIFGTDWDLWKQFVEVPEVNIVLNNIGDIESNFRFIVVSKTTDKPVKNQDSLAKVIRQPNWFQGSTEFWKTNSIFRSVYGGEILYFMKPTTRITSLNTLPLSQVSMKWDKEKPLFLQLESSLKYIYNHNSTEYPLAAKNVIYLNDNSMDGITAISKLDALRPAIENLRKVYKKKGIILDSPLGVFSSDAGDTTGKIALQPEEREAVQKDLKRFNLDGDYSNIVTNQPLKYSQFNINVKQMMLFEEAKETNMRICDAFGYPYKLLASEKAGVFDEAYYEARKALYLDILPRVQTRVDAMNNYIGAANKSFEIRIDTSHIPELQENQTKKAELLKTMTESLSKLKADGVITVEEYKTEIDKILGNG